MKCKKPISLTRFLAWKGSFTTKLYRPVEFEKLIEVYWEPFINTTQRNILIEIHQNSKISKRELVENIKLSKTAIDKNIDKLKELGILERRGSDRGGSWIIIHKRSL
jgi:ATP-dependent DNA helicase RecG